MGGAGFGDVDAGGVDAGMAQNVGQAHDVMLHAVENPGKQVPQVVGEDFFLGNPSRGAKALHHGPDPAPIQGLAGFSDKNGAGLDFPAFCVRK